MFIILTGNPVDGLTGIGPFETEDEAIQYASWGCIDDWTVTKLYEP